MPALHSDAEEDPITNQAAANGTDYDGDDLVEDLSNIESVNVVHDAGVLTITKSADVDGDDLFDEANGDDGHTVHGATISYRFEVTYDSDDNAPATNVTVTEADCTLGAATGDTDGDNRLDESETWAYGCDYTVPAHADDEDDPFTDTATADGDDFDGDALATATSNTDLSVDIRHAPVASVSGPGSGERVPAPGSTQYTFAVTDADRGRHVHRSSRAIRSAARAPIGSLWPARSALDDSDGRLVQVQVPGRPRAADIGER